MTHYDDLASEACVLYNCIAYRVLCGESLTSAMEEEIEDTRYAEAVKEKPRQVLLNGYVESTFKWCLPVVACSL